MFLREFPRLIYSLRLLLQVSDPIIASEFSWKAVFCSWSFSPLAFPWRVLLQGSRSPFLTKFIAVTEIFSYLLKLVSNPRERTICPCLPHNTGTQIKPKELILGVSPPVGGCTSPICLQRCNYLVGIKQSIILLIIPRNCLVLYGLHSFSTWGASFDSNKHLGEGIFLIPILKLRRQLIIKGKGLGPRQHSS